AAGGIPEIVRDGQTGLLIPPADGAALADAVIALLRDRERARALGRAGRDLVERAFSIPAMVGGNMEVYQALLARVRPA
ncbi:MAG: glycosyltransferase, partial [Gammaproteobacteria bacterium]